MQIIKHILLLSTCCSLSVIGFGQSQRSFDKLVSETNAFLTQYSKLNPFGSDWAIKDLDLTRQEREDFVVKALKDEELNGSRDSVGSYFTIGFFHHKIITNIYAILEHSQLPNNPLETIFTSYEDDLTLVVSEDKKLYNIALFEKLGGTYRSHTSIMYFTEIDPVRVPSPYERDQGVSPKPYAVFEGDGFTGIHTLETNEGTKYVLTGYVRGCSYCFETNIMLVQFRDSVFEQDFTYSVNSRSWEGGITYHPDSNTITVDYLTDNLTTYCGCSISNEEYDYHFNKEESEYETKKCHCTFEFNGSTFEVMKESWERVKEE